MVTCATIQQKRQEQKSGRFFHYGVAAVSGEGCGEAEGSGVDSVEDGGAVVESGKSEAGGGSETSESDGGNGAISFEDGGGPLSCEPRRFPALLVGSGGRHGRFLQFPGSPTFARSSLIRFLAFSPSVDPGWVRITSL
jgi:hypothetical protein